jgi:cephalosporin-C deacetylase
VNLAKEGPYLEIASFLKAFGELYDTAFRTLSYFDCLNLAPGIQCRTVISNCLWDEICPPSTIFAVHHHIGGPKQMEVYPFHKHEIPYDHSEIKFQLLAEVLKP